MNAHQRRVARRKAGRTWQLVGKNAVKFTKSLQKVVDSMAKVREFFERLSPFQKEGSFTVSTPTHVDEASVLVRRNSTYGKLGQKSWLYDDPPLPGEEGGEPIDLAQKRKPSTW